MGGSGYYGASRYGYGYPSSYYGGYGGYGAGYGAYSRYGSGYGYGYPYGSSYGSYGAGYGYVPIWRRLIWRLWPWLLRLLLDVVQQLTSLSSVLKVVVGTKTLPKVI